MQTTILQFSSLEDLINFKTFIQTENVELNFNNLTISCQISDEEFNRTIASFPVTILYRGNEVLVSERQTALQ